MELFIDAIRKNHALKLLGRLEAFRLSGIKSDCTIEVENVFFHVHSLVLCGCSEYLCRILRSKPPGQNHYSIKLPEFQPNSFKTCVEFMYTGKAVLTDDSLCDITRSANRLGLNDLVGLCLRSVTLLNCTDMWRLQGEIKFADNENYLKEFIAKNIRNIVAGNKFVALSKEDLCNFLCGIDFIEEDLLWQALFAWISVGPSGRTEHVYFLLKTWANMFSLSYLINQFYLSELVSDTNKERLLSDRLESAIVAGCFCSFLNEICEPEEPSYEEARGYVKTILHLKFSRISEGEEIGSLTSKAMLFLFHSLSIAADLEKKKLDLALTWTNYRLLERKDYFERFFSLIDISGFTPTTLNAIAAEDLVRSSNVCCLKVLFARSTCETPTTSSGTSGDTIGRTSKHENQTLHGVRNVELSGPPPTSASVNRKRAKLTLFPNKATPKKRKLHRQTKYKPKDYIAFHEEHSNKIEGINMKGKKECKVLSKTSAVTDDFEGIAKIEDQLYWLQGTNLKKRRENGRWEKLTGPTRKLGRLSKIAVSKTLMYIADTGVIFCYDARLNTWEQRTVSKVTGLHFCVCADEERLYILGGNETPTRYLEYTQHSHNVLEGVSMLRPRVNSAAATLNGKLYVMGGSSDVVTGKSVEVYYQELELWMDLPSQSMKVGRSKLCACVHQDKIYAVGGAVTPTTDSVEVLDTTAMEKGWKRFATVRVIKTPFTACIVKTSEI